MFKKFTIGDLTANTRVKSSIARGIRSKIEDQFPTLEPVLDEIMPKKAPMFIAKCHPHVSMIVVEGKVKFFQIRDGPFMPTLKILHRYPDILPHFQCDTGAIKFVLDGVNVMCPGLTSAGGSMVDVPAETPVAIMAEGKEHAMAIGITTMSTEEIRTVNKGHGLENIHYLNDGLYLIADDLS
mmetsp:Transcript_49490/g.124439  ORF Transcript_49490/g.124439 Transcript_49490/m.124439 type:complete len:182 (-) Transcript_49490:39-584(-)|eukprot:CAMPEP_0177661068 /NCGR_PEP_ID=MMETSP0447-20121125/18441_1 /TAXON_ID=0 /ORGANISM="Stygamoeba regulata, Strain BSH-02190019" /LENGTH=181 /DNA_ID=CAMNT_0019166305 /DNA_START=128 /DNA_END=673 /DNA_ORIENTATION=-